MEIALWLLGIVALGLVLFGLAIVLSEFLP